MTEGPESSAWTDGNQHDPGVTLLELFAWFAGALSLALALYAYRKRRWRWPP